MTLHEKLAQLEADAKSLARPTVVEGKRGADGVWIDRKPFDIELTARGIADVREAIARYG